MKENNEMNNSIIEEESVEKIKRTKSKSAKWFLLIVGVCILIFIMISVRDTNCFYKGNLKRVQTEYITNSDNYKVFSENDLKDFIKVPIDSYLKDNLNWNDIYPYYYRYANENDVIFRNQGFYVNVEGQECLAIYLTPSDIYFNERVLKDASQKKRIKVVQCFVDCIGESEVLNNGRDDLYYILSVLDSKSVFLRDLLFSVTVDIHFDKPVIYLYPKVKTEITLELEGVNLTTTYPNYNNGWNVTAYPDGTIIDKLGREYNYLYWEGKSYNFEPDSSKGFIVSKDNYIEFLEEKLDYIGLSNKESADFISYWLPYMNEYNYCLVSFQMENYSKAVNIEYSIEPDNELRVFVLFKGLDKPIKIEEQDLSYYSNFERSGFTVVEWGGGVIN